ncbi:MAG TPA: DUF5666 domain-containing protein [Thermoanaerobaculia bacterium]|nr:DUF5666 domain-containing protein [Thermoanaerobaculia bacterium]
MLTTVMGVAAMLILGACHNERATITGVYGSGVITGEVVMSEGISAAGVEVSVRGTGMITRLAADGQFMFAGVPEGTALDFQRAADGIQATLQLEQASGHVVVELSANAAKKSGRRRAAGKTPALRQFEGIVVTASATELVIDDSKGQQQTFVLNATTDIRKGDKPVLAADVRPGWRVHVKASIADDGAQTAVRVIVQNTNDDEDEDDGENGPKVGQYEGLVVNASATELVINDSKGQQQTFVVNAETDIRKGNTPVLAADIQPGWRVHVKATSGNDGTKTAVRVTVQNTKAK